MARVEGAGSGLGVEGAASAGLGVVGGGWLFLFKSHLLPRLAVNLINARVTARKLLIFFEMKFALIRQPTQLPRRVGMILVVANVCFDAIARLRFVRVNEHRVIDVQHWKVR